MSWKRTLSFISTLVAFPTLGWVAVVCLPVKPIHAIQIVQEEEEAGNKNETTSVSENKDPAAQLTREITDAGTFLELLGGKPFGRLTFAPVKLSKEDLAKVITELRKRYPFQSVAKKLRYEKERVEARGRGGRADIVTGETDRRLEAADVQHYIARIRSQSLQKLHSDKVEEFINRSGFGMTRMPRPGVERLPIVKLPSQPLSNPDLAHSVEYQGPPVEIPADKSDVPGESGVSMISAAEVRGIHAHSQRQFGNGPENGYVKDREHVAGFESHRVGYLSHIRPPIPAPSSNAEEEKGPKETWQVKRMELVSLLNFDEPAVYISNEMPQMEKIKDAKVRPLDRFEQAGLQMLRDGEDNHIEATLNRVKMLGSLRAGKSCTDCHYVKRGELLGAFSYDIVRVPAIGKKSGDQ